MATRFTRVELKWPVNFDSVTFFDGLIVLNYTPPYTESHFRQNMSWECPHQVTFRNDVSDGCPRVSEYGLQDLFLRQGKYDFNFESRHGVN